MDGLSSVHLVTETVDGRYQLHDLVRGYARHLSTVHDADRDRQASLTRLFDYYRGTAGAAMDMAFPLGRDRRPTLLTPSRAFADAHAARGWLDSERLNLLAVTSAAAEDWPGHLTDLAGTLALYFDISGHHADAITLHSRALAAAQATRDRPARATALRNLGVACWQRGEATDFYLRQLTLWRELGDRRGESNALDNLGSVHQRRRRYAEAGACHERAAAIARTLGDRAGEANCRNNLGIVRQWQGRHDEARGLHEWALARYREAGDRNGELAALDNLGSLLRRQNQPEEAAEYFTMALTIARDIGDRTSEAVVLDGLGLVRMQQSRYDVAYDHHQQALTIAHEIGAPQVAMAALNGLGEAARAAGHLDEALGHHLAALRSDVDDLYQQARAHDNLARIRAETGELDAASDDRRRARALFAELRAPDAEDVRRRTGTP